MDERREESPHWLARPRTIRGLWIAFIAVLAATVAAGFAVDMHPHFGIERLPAFFAVFGFGACVAMVVASKLLGALLKREDTYYDR
ncbi:MAG: hypothetical protein KF738_15885 [Burkholderiales bacterium]|nr:hypothetical protein [Burkholderiales bacterium]